VTHCSYHTVSVLNTKLRGHQKKISQLQSNIKELVRTKSAVEEGVQSVLRDNEELSRANEILNRDNLALCDEVEVLRLKKGR
jgi:FtsZ-binding cell division protein ZapB